MADWVDSVTGWLQFGANIGALIAGAAVWKLYVDKLKAALTAKDAELSNANAHRDLWKDKAEELDKRSPEVLEQALSARVKAHQDEIERLSADKDKNAEAIENLEEEKYSLEKDLARTRGFRLMLAIEDEEDERDEGSDDASGAGAGTDEDEEEIKIGVVFLGEVAVDSGQLMVTDPCYVDSQWRPPSDEDLEWWRDQSPGAEIDGTQTPGEHEERLFAYSYKGASEATLSNGYGGLAFDLGHAGAGVSFATAWGDGIYPVYGELHNDKIVRIYITTG